MRKILFVFKCTECELTKAVFYPEDAKDEEIDRDYADWTDSINKGYWSEV